MNKKPWQKGGPSPNPLGRGAVGSHTAVSKATAAPGVNGVSVFGGYISSNENHSDLTGQRRWETFQNATHKPVIALGVRYFTGLLAGTEWHAEENAAGGKGARKGVEIVEKGLLCAPLGMRSWSMVVEKASLFQLFGMSVHATAMRKMSEGLIGYCAIEHRPQDTIEQWLRKSERDPFHAFVQRSRQTGARYEIPLDECFYCVDETLSDSPEGGGLLRHVIEYVRRLGIFEDLEAKAAVEDMGGMPFGRAPLSEIYENTAGDSDAKRAAVLTATLTLRDIMEKRNKTPEEAMWLLLDSDTYRNPDGSPSSVAKFALEIVRTETANLPQLDTIIRRVELQIARVLGIEFALMGSDGGAFAMHADKTSTFGTMLQTTLSKMAWWATHQLARRLVARNGLDPDTCTPTLKASPISTEAILTCTQALANLAMAGLRPDDPAVDVIRDRLKLPKQPERTNMGAPRMPYVPGRPPPATEDDPAGADGDEDVGEKPDEEKTPDE